MAIFSIMLGTFWAVVGVLAILSSEGSDKDFGFTLVSTFTTAITLIVWGVWGSL